MMPKEDYIYLSSRLVKEVFSLGGDLDRTGAGAGARPSAASVSAPQVPAMSLDRFLLRLPKVELHVHLEGSMRPAVLLELARRNGIELPAQRRGRPQALVPLHRFRALRPGLPRLLARPAQTRGLPTPGLDFLAEQAYQNVVYTEAHFTISTHLANGAQRRRGAGRPGRGHRGRGAALRRHPAADPGHRPQRRRRPPRTRPSNGRSPAGKRGIVVALGLSGSERLYPNEPFREHFAAAKRNAGLHRVAHAGEHAGPESIRSVLEVCARRAHRPRRAGGRGPVPGRGAAGRPDPARRSARPPTSAWAWRPTLPSHPFDRALPGGPGRSPSIRTTRPSSTPTSPSSTCACTRPSATPPPSSPASPWPPCGSPSCPKPSKTGPGGELPPAVRRPGPGAVRGAGGAAGELEDVSRGALRPIDSAKMLPSF